MTSLFYKLIIHSLRDHPPNLMRLVPTQGSLKPMLYLYKGRAEMPFHYRRSLIFDSVFTLLYGNQYEVAPTNHLKTVLD